MRRASVALLVVGVGLLWTGCGDSRDQSGASTVTLHATRSAFKAIPQTIRPPSPGGNAFIVSDKIAGGGHVDAYCVASPRPKTAWCAITVVRPKGQVTAQGIFENAPKLSVARSTVPSSGLSR